MSPVSPPSINSKFTEIFPTTLTSLGYTISYSPSSPSPCMTLSMPNYIFSMLFHLCPSGCGCFFACRLHSACLTHRYLFPSCTLLHPHPLYPSLSRRKDLDPTGGWMLALLCPSIGPVYPHCFVPIRSPPTNQTQLNTTLPQLTVSSTMSLPTPTPTKPSTSRLWLFGPAPTPAICPDQSRAA